MTPTSRVRFEPVEGAERLFTPAFNEFLAALHDRLNARALKLRADRARLLADAHAGRRPAPLPPSEATTGDWKVPPVPDELKKPGIEISGPCSITSMFINALNPGPEGERAEGDLDDDEDSGGHRLVDTVRAAVNRLAAVSRDSISTTPSASANTRSRRASCRSSCIVSAACTWTNPTCASTTPR